MTNTYRTDCVVKLIILRYALLPKQFLTSDEAEGMDVKSFEDSYQHNLRKKVLTARNFVLFVRALNTNVSYSEKLHEIALFAEALTAVDLTCYAEDFDLADDFPPEDVNDYLDGFHIPKEMSEEYDDACIFYASNREGYYSWYNKLPDKSLIVLLEMYAELLDKYNSTTTFD